MTPDRWQEVKRLFDAALERPASDRDAFLNATCGGDGEMRAEVAGLLAALSAAGEGFETTLPTVKREWQSAKAWLHRELTRGSAV